MPRSQKQAKTVRESSVWEEHTEADAASALYVHIPFCARKCAYCDFASWATRAEDPLMNAYAASVLHELSCLEETGLLEGTETAYIGGGTPSYLGARLLPIVERLSSFGVLELTSEANPDSLTADFVSSLKEAGLTRISLGVQSTDDGVLAALGRIHSAEEALQALSSAVSAGLSVSADLMCALPGETDEIFQRSVCDVLAQGVSHVSVYPLMIEEGTAFGRRYGGEELPSWNDPDIQARRMERAEKTLCTHGFHRYEVASYAKAGHECRHNKAYWTGRNYLGIGTGASGMLSRAAYRRLRTCLPQLPYIADDIYRVRLRNTSTRTDYAEGHCSASTSRSSFSTGARRSPRTSCWRRACPSRSTQASLLLHVQSLEERSIVLSRRPRKKGFWERAWRSQNGAGFLETSSSSSSGILRERLRHARLRCREAVL